MARPLSLTNLLRFGENLDVRVRCNRGRFKRRTQFSKGHQNILRHCQQNVFLAMSRRIDVRSVPGLRLARLSAARGSGGVLSWTGRVDRITNESERGRTRDGARTHRLELKIPPGMEQLQLAISFTPPQGRISGNTVNMGVLKG